MQCDKSDCDGNAEHFYAPIENPKSYRKRCRYHSEILVDFIVDQWAAHYHVRHIPSSPRWMWLDESICIVLTIMEE
jgi:hypothetical protein